MLGHPNSAKQFSPLQLNCVTNKFWSVETPDLLSYLKKKKDGAGLYEKKLD